MKDKFKKLEKQILDSYPDELVLTTRDFSTTLSIDTSKITVNEFIQYFLILYNGIFITSLKNKNVIHTIENKRRSLGDVYLICRNYFPDVSLREVLKSLYFITNIQGFRTSYCYQINKRVWYYSRYGNNAVFNKGKTDEWGHRYNYYLSDFLKENE